MNTRISYQYRDGDNYKVLGDVIVAGKATLNDRAVITNSLDINTWFIPQQVALPTLQLKLTDINGWDDNTDHLWHELLSVEHSIQSVTIDMTIDQIVAAFFQASSDGWNDQLPTPPQGTAT